MTVKTESKIKYLKDLKEKADVFKKELEGSIVISICSGTGCKAHSSDNLYTIFGQNLAGSMVIDASQPITAFMLYDSLTTTWKAGLSALPLE